MCTDIATSGQKIISKVVQLWFRNVLRPVLHSDSSRPEAIHDSWELELEQREGHSQDWRMIDFRIHGKERC